MAVAVKNTTLMRDTFRYIEDHPEEHDQDNWADQTECGTVRCFAGTAVHVSPDYRLVHDPYDWFHVVRVSDGAIMTICDAADEALGLDEDESDAMFCEAGNLEELYYQAKRCTGIDFRPEVVPA